MPNDYITLRALASELHDKLHEGKIDKIQMPERDEIVLLIRAKGENHRLVISCNASNPRIHLTQIKKTSAPVAPSFCMHLRKYLLGGTIEEIGLLAEDRIVAIRIAARNELHDLLHYTLIAEMMGRYSNILLVSPRGVISDALKQVSYDTATKRCLLPSAPYSAPTQSKCLLSDRDGIRACLAAYDGSISLATYLMRNLAGFSAPTAEFLVRSLPQGTCDGTHVSADAVLDTIDALLHCYGSALFMPCVSISDGAAQDYFITPYTQDVQRTDSLNAAIERCVAEKDLHERRNEHTRVLRKCYRALCEKTDKKLEKSRQRYAESLDQEDLRIQGELLTANLYQVRKGDTSVTVVDYYQPDNAMRTIKLDPKLSPQQNAQSYFKRYAKAKRTEQIVQGQIAELESLREYLLSIAPSIEMCNTDQEIEEIFAELAAAGATVRRKSATQKSKPAQPILYDVDGFAICVGKNNYQNEKLTFKLAGGNDLWVHTKDVPSAHVIVFAEGRTIPDSVIQTACEICAYHSRAAESDKVACDYTQRKMVRRHPIGKPGMVLYTVYRTAYVTPNAHTELIIRP